MPKTKLELLHAWTTQLSIPWTIPAFTSINTGPVINVAVAQEFRLTLKNAILMNGKTYTVKFFFERKQQWAIYLYFWYSKWGCAIEQDGHEIKRYQHLTQQYRSRTANPQWLSDAFSLIALVCPQDIASAAQQIIVD